MDGYTVALNPTSMAASVASLLSTLAVTGSATNDLQQQNEQSLMDSLCAHCESLHLFMSDLERVLMSYARHWTSSDNPHLQIPLDPMLYTFVSDCMLTVLGLQEEATRLLEIGNQEGESIQVVLKKVGCTDEKEEVTFDRLYQEMEIHNINLDDFIPIMKV